MNVSIVILGTSEEQHCQQHGNQQESEGNSEEELNGHKERWKDKIMNNVVFFLENPHAASVADIIESMGVLKVI